VRPLLSWHRHELAAIAAAMPTVDDPSNRNDRFARVRLRAWLADDRSPLDPAQIARSAAYVAAVQDDLDELRDWTWRTRRCGGEGVAVEVAGLPRTLCRMLARTAIRQVRCDHAIVSPAFTESTNVEALLDALSAGRGATQGGVMATASGTTWHFAPAPPRRAT